LTAFISGNLTQINSKTKEIYKLNHKENFKDLQSHFSSLYEIECVCHTPQAIFRHNILSTARIVLGIKEHSPAFNI